MAGKKKSIESLLAKHLGKDVAQSIVGKIDLLVKQGKTSDQIEKIIGDDLVNHVEKEVLSTVIAKIGPITPIKIKPIQSDIKSKISPISVSVKIGPTVSVKSSIKPGPSISTKSSIKTGPGPYTRGSR